MNTSHETAGGDRFTDAVFTTLAAMIRDVIGEDWVHEIAIDRDTSFNDDLELESIEFVALAEKIAAKYGRSVDFAGWLATMDLDQIISLHVGDVAEYIAACLSSNTTA